MMNSEDPQSGTIITFYSYKGGAGRTMALANIACLLSKRFEKSWKRTLMMDWDLEAPGLHSFFSELSGKIKDEKLGVINYFDSLRKLFDENQDLYKEIIADEQGWQKLEKEVSVDDYIISDVRPNLDFMKAGKFDSDYAELVNSFDWIDFYNRYGEAIRIFKEIISIKYQYILVDSRTGLTDVSGICTMILPEKLVGVFTPNRQSLYGLLKLIRQAFQYRRASNDDRPLAVFPLPSRIDIEDHIQRDEWYKIYLDEFQKLFQEAYGVDECNLSKYFNEVIVPHSKDYAYGEKIAVLIEKRNEAFSFLRAYNDFLDRVVELDHAWQELPVKKETVKQYLKIEDESVIDVRAIDYTDSNRDNKIFISYATEDFEMAERLYDDLKKAGVEPWLDRKDLLPGQNWRTIISQVIRSCKYFLLLISSYSVSKRGYVNKEQKIALELFDEFPDNEIFIIPALLDDTKPFDNRLNNIHWADLSDYEKGLEQILMVLKSEKK